MRSIRGLWWKIVVAVVIVALFLARSGWRRHGKARSSNAISDLSLTSPLNSPGGGAAPDDAYAVYSALYNAPAGEPLVFSQDSVTDIPQVDGNCLKPSTPEEREMVDAFTAANRQSHRWEARFTIPVGYRMVARDEASLIQNCLDAHGHGGPRCAPYAQVAHIRFLGVPGFDGAHAHALVSVIRMCGGFCGSGGIFEMEKAGGTWRRAEAGNFTRDCSWMY